MSNNFVLVRGAARDFDDIYEGTPLELIAKRQQLVSLIESKFGEFNWRQVSSEKNKWQGNSKKSNLRVEFQAGPTESVSMVSLLGFSELAVIEFAQENSLNMLE